jgi:hypothetical protein
MRERVWESVASEDAMSSASTQMSRGGEIAHITQGADNTPFANGSPPFFMRS